MKFLSLIKVLFFVAILLVKVEVQAVPPDAVKIFSGKLVSGQICKVKYGPAIRIDNSTLRINEFVFDLGGRKVELTGAKLVSSELNLQTNMLSGQGVLDRKVVITSEVLGVGYETGILVDFNIKIDSQANPLEYHLTTQGYRNDFVFGTWVEGERGKIDVFDCSK